MKWIINDIILKGVQGCAYIHNCIFYHQMMKHTREVWRAFKRKVHKLLVPTQHKSSHVSRSKSFSRGAKIDLLSLILPQEEISRNYHSSLRQFPLHILFFKCSQNKWFMNPIRGTWCSGIMQGWLKVMFLNMSLSWVGSALPDHVKTDQK